MLLMLFHCTFDLFWGMVNFEMEWSLQSDALHIHILFPNQWQVRPSDPRACIQFQEVAGAWLEIQAI